MTYIFLYWPADTNTWQVDRLNFMQNQIKIEAKDFA